MSTQLLLQDLAAGGVSLAVDGDNLRVRGALTPDLRERIRAEKPSLLAALQDQAADAAADQEARRLAERVGRMMLDLQERGRDWSHPERCRKVDALIVAHHELDAARARTGKPLEAYGWTYDATGLWQRV